MRFDDRLLTVLSQPADDRHDIAVRWWQLVDLVARAGANAASPSVAQALDSIRADAPSVDEHLRAAAARAVAALPLPLGLLEYFASDRLSVSAPVLAAATLEPAQWRALMSCADEETRKFIETLHPEIREAAAELTEELVEPAPAEEPARPATPSLHEVVERIERRRRARAFYRRGGASAAQEVSPALFRWESDPGGEIAWVEGAPRGALIGRSIARSQAGVGDKLDPQMVRAFQLRAPFRDATLMLAGEGPLSGEWKISGVPAFEPSDGRFAGYRGVALREEAAPQIAEAPEAFSDPASVRELVHEIKTPLNAITGFAEIIEGQYLGPAERPYRDRAREIVRQAALLLTAIDDLDFAARVHSDAQGQRPRVNLGELIERAVPAMRDLASERQAEIDASRSAREMIAAIEPELADRLIFRLGSALIEQAQPGEHLRLSVGQAANHWRLSLSRPAALSRLPEDELLGAGATFEQGFSLRLLRGLARIAGAEVSAPADSITLHFPRA